MKINKIVLFSVVSLGFVGCAGQYSAQEQQLASDFYSSVACDPLASKTVYNAFEKLDGKTPVSGEFVRSALLSELELRQADGDSDLKKRFAQKAQEFVELLDHDLRSLDQDEYETQLARIENGSRISPEYAQISAKASELLGEMKAMASSMKISCDSDSMAEISQPVESEATSGSNGIDLKPVNSFEGMRWVMATAYQSCQVLQQKPVDSSTPNLSGVAKENAVDSVGWGRKYTNLTALRASHPYVHGITYGPGCVDASVKPLVYDYGGSAVVQSSKLNVFVNGGSGGSALGIDCSAFVSAGLASSGLLYVKNTQNKAVYKRYATKDFVNPEASNWSCYSRISVSASQVIRPGDLATIRGHIVAIDQVGNDPFGIQGFTTASQCDTIDGKKFDFVVIQSSPSKNSIGIHRHRAYDYLSGESTMRKLFVDYAKAACKARLNGTTTKPMLTDMSIIRHLGTPECLATRVQMVNESCIASCPDVKQ